MNTRQVAYTAMVGALSVLILYLSTILPTGRIALVAAAGILPAILVIKYGVLSGFILYGLVSVLSLLLLPNKMNAVLYILLFGHYPMFKSLIERINKLWVEGVLKLLLFNVLLTVLLLINLAVLGPGILEGITIAGTAMPIGVAVVLLYIVGNIVFVIYDIGFTGLISGFIRRLARWM